MPITGAESPAATGGKAVATWATAEPAEHAEKTPLASENLMVY
jgi:hypothetical protein